MNTLDYILKKYNIKVDRQHLIDVEGMHGSADLSKLFAELGFNYGVEVGVDKGLFSEVLCKDNPQLKLFCVDPWINSAFADSNPHKERQEYFNECYEESKARLAPYNATIVKKTSMEALADFEDNSLDFVYIDANHDFLNVIQDVHNWYKKVKVGGIISGHDFCYFSYSKFNHVKRALIAYARSYRMIPFFAVLYVPKREGLKRDQYRSWFYVKDKDNP